MATNSEPCAGCGVFADNHPIVGIKMDEDGKFGAFPVCGTCHRDPSHRTSTLKMHFFPVKMKALALERAGSENIG